MTRERGAHIEMAHTLRGKRGRVLYTARGVESQQDLAHGADVTNRLPSSFLLCDAFFKDLALAASRRLRGLCPYSCTTVVYVRQTETQGMPSPIITPSEHQYTK